MDECWLKVKQTKTLDLFLWNPLDNLVDTPIETFIWWTLFNIIFVLFGELNWVIYHYLTVFGFIGIYLVLVYYLICFITRSISFPMSNKLALRSMEKEIANNQASSFLQSSYSFRTLISFCNSVSTAAPGQREMLIKFNSNNFIANCDKSKSFFYEPLRLSLQSYEHYLESKNSLSPVEIVLCNTTKSLIKRITILLNCYDKLKADLSNSKLAYSLLQSVLSVELLSNFLTEFEENMSSKLELLNEIDRINEYVELNALVERNHGLFNVYNKKKSCNCTSCNLNKVEKGENELLQVNQEESKAKTYNFNLLDEGSLLFLILSKLSNFMKELRSCYKPLPAIYNINFARASFEVYYKSKHISISLKDGSVIDGMFIHGYRSLSAKDNSFDKHNIIPTDSGLKNLFIICNPNAAVYEYARMQYDFVDYYLKQNINIFFLNYRGYAASTGYPSPDQNCSDINEVVSYLIQNNYATPGKIGVHALSIGGLMAATLCAKSQEYGISLFVFDRNFSSLADTAAALVHPITKFALKNIIGWEGSNVENYLRGSRLSLNQAVGSTAQLVNNSPFCILLCDPNDEIIHNEASLKVGVARRVLSELLKKKTTNLSFMDSCRTRLLDSTPLVDQEIEVPWLKQLFSSPTFSLDMALNFVLLQTKLSNLIASQLLGLNQQERGAYSIMADAFKGLLTLKVCGQTFQVALQTYLSQVDLDDVKSKREQIYSGKVKLPQFDAIKDWVSCLIIWQPRTVNNSKFQEKLNTLSLYFRRLKNTESDIIEAWKVVSEVTFFEKLLNQLNDFIKDTKLNDNNYLIPLSCGHNNSFKKSEWKLYKELLVKAGWAKI